MRIIFSRKGFDSSTGGCPSPLINSIPISLPIPSGYGEPYQYTDLIHPIAGNLGTLVETTTKNKITRHDFAHADPTLPADWGQAVLGQAGAAAAHLRNQNVQIGDIFIFFGLFSSKEEKPHHRIFGLMEIESIHTLGPNGANWQSLGLLAPHPHTERKNQNVNNTLYIGRGKLATKASPSLRLSKDTIPSEWLIPTWLADHGLSYHANPKRWNGNTLKLVNRGQEFVSHVDNDPRPRSWIEKIRKNL